MITFFFREREKKEKGIKTIKNSGTTIGKHAFEMINIDACVYVYMWVGVFFVYACVVYMYAGLYLCVMVWVCLSVCGCVCLNAYLSVSLGMSVCMSVCLSLFFVLVYLKSCVVPSSLSALRSPRHFRLAIKVTATHTSSNRPIINITRENRQ